MFRKSAVTSAMVPLLVLVLVNFLCIFIDFFLLHSVDILRHLISSRVKLIEDYILFIQNIFYCVCIVFVNVRLCYSFR